MEQLLLWRVNKKSGPYSIDEIKSSIVQSSDLFWIERKSRQWQNLQGIMTLTDKNNTGCASLQSIISKQKEGIEKDVEYERHDMEKQDVKYWGGRQIKNHKKLIIQNYFWMSCLTLSFLFLGYLINEILVQDRSSFSLFHKNKATPLAALQEDQVIARSDHNFQNAISRETVIVERSDKKEKKKPRPFNWRKQVYLSANEYKKGILGGIKELEIALNNHSDHFIDKAVIEVQFLRPNGKWVATEKYLLRSIASHDKKLLSIPPTKRGYKIKYQLLNVSTKEFKPVLSFT
jgi:hypothetical protein